MDNEPSLSSQHLTRRLESVEAGRLAPGRPERPLGRYLNRELSWLDFNERVLALAARRSLPLLERVKFLAIFSRNLDEFFQVRVGSLKMQLEAGFAASGPDDETTRNRLQGVSARVRELVAREGAVFAEQLVPDLAAAGIHLSSWEQLDDEDRAYLDAMFDERIFPILTPLAVDPAHPFPYISNLSLNLAVVVRAPGELTRRIARVKVPAALPRFVVLPDGERFVPLEQLIARRLSALFPGMEIVEHFPFRVTRNADYDIDLDGEDDMVAAVESVLRRRRRSQTVVRLEVDSSMSGRDAQPARARAAPGRARRLSRRRAARPPGALGRSPPLDRPELKLEPWAPVTQSSARLDGLGLARCVRRDPRRRSARPAPVRLVRDLGRGVHRAGRQRPGGARDQADALPDLVGGEPDDGGPDPRRRRGEAGGLHRRAEGALRRGDEHRLGAASSRTPACTSSTASSA